MKIMTETKSATVCGCFAALLLVTLISIPAMAEQSSFETPGAAAQALIDAMVAEDSEALRDVLGTDAGELSSGDPIGDAIEREDFVDAAVEAAGIEQEDGVDDRAILVVGDDDWPFPIPLVREASGWRFDTDAGLEELYVRRIGRNELYAIAVAEAYAQAQYEYAGTDRYSDGVPEFADRFISTEGKRDGLYWPAVEGEPQSPVGEFLVAAAADGYRKAEDGGLVPYHGYFYRMLDGQGPHAAGGAMSYVSDGHMNQGFGLIAYPAEYGNSGIMSFMVNQQGIVFEKDLGEQTTEVAASITVFDPDRSWEPVVD